MTASTAAGRPGVPRTGPAGPTPAASLVGPPSADDVIRWAHLGPATDQTLVEWATDAANAWVAGLPVIADRPDPAAAWPADPALGAVMLAARLYHRRQSPGGVESFTDGVVYLPRRDADVDLLLGLNAYAAPGVG